MEVNKKLFHKNKYTFIINKDETKANQKTVFKKQTSHSNHRQRRTSCLHIYSLTTLGEQTLPPAKCQRQTSPSDLWIVTCSLLTLTQSYTLHSSESVNIKSISKAVCACITPLTPSAKYNKESLKSSIASIFIMHYQMAQLILNYQRTNRG